MSGFAAVASSVCSAGKRLDSMVISSALRVWQMMGVPRAKCPAAAGEHPRTKDKRNQAFLILLSRLLDFFLDSHGFMRILYGKMVHGFGRNGRRTVRRIPDPDSITETELEEESLPRCRRIPEMTDAGIMIKW
jgi:hypothetical protein